MTDRPDGPATRAARRGAGRGTRERAYPQPADVTGTGTAVALAATYALLGAQTREEAAAILRTAVNDLGANCYLTKPVDLEQFLRLVQTIEDFWLGVVRLPPRVQTD